MGMKLNPQTGLAMPDYSNMGGWGTQFQQPAMMPADYSIAAPVPDGYTGVPGLTAPTTGFWGSKNPSVLGGGAAMTGPGAGNGGGAISSWLRDNGIIGSTDQNGIRTDGYGGLALGAATGLGSLYLGMQQYNLAKETLASNKAQFDKNYAAQRQTLNTNLQDRQRARVASNSGAYQSVGDYMSANGVR